MATGAEKVVAPILEAYEVTRFTEFEPNPKKGDVDRGVELFRANPADLIIAVGGGTAPEGRGVHDREVPLLSARSLGVRMAPSRSRASLDRRRRIVRGRGQRS